MDDRGMDDRAMDDRGYIRLGHGSGGKLTHELVTGLFMKQFHNDALHAQGDSAILPGHSGWWAMSTDAYVVDPIFFPGGDIGSLAISGTVNDLAVSGAEPRELTAAFILEEGFAIADLERIVTSMAKAAREAGVRIVAGDTKVVHRGKCDKIFITTAGVGWLDERLAHISGGARVAPGDRILINGHVGDHGITILGQRESLRFESPIQTDAACLNGLIRQVTDACQVHFMRDATRGGLATVLAELAGSTGVSLSAEEDAVPVREEVRGICEVFGYDPLYMANEGKVVMVVPPEETDRALQIMRAHPLGRDAAVIGEVDTRHPGRVVLQTGIGGRRFLDMLTGEQLPRIC